MRMLGRFESPGCCPGTRGGWYRLRRAYRLDCSGADTSTRRRKRKEQRQVRAEVARWLRAPDLSRVDLR